MKKFILATLVATLGVALSAFVAFVAYISYLDKCLEDDEANDSGNGSKSNNRDSGKGLKGYKHSSNGEFDPSEYSPCEDIENPVPDEKSMKTYMQEIMAYNQRH